MRGVEVYLAFPSVCNEKRIGQNQVPDKLEGNQSQHQTNKNVISGHNVEIFNDQIVKRGGAGHIQNDVGRYLRYQKNSDCCPNDKRKV